MRRGTLSVCIPVHNGAAFLADALQSVLSQTRPADEIIVVDDGSQDDSAVSARRTAPQALVLSQANAGSAAARNAAVAAASGEYIAFLDQDDLMTPERLRLQTAILDAQPDIDLVFGRQFKFQHGEDPRPWITAPSAQVRVSSAVTSCALCSRRSVFDRVGPFRTDRRYDEFVHWLVRAEAAGMRMAVPPDVVICRRVHAHNLSRTVTLQQYPQLIKAILDERRGRRDAA